MLLKPVFILLFSLSLGATLMAESRAYLLDVFDHVSKNQWEIKTNFSPDTYINSHGGRGRLTVLVKATWMCYGDNSGFRPPCKMPEPKRPRFKVGDTVKVTLDKHITQGWTGKVVLSLYREDLKSNVYGVNFGGKRSLYNRYYEFNLNSDLKIDINQPSIGRPGPLANSQPVNLPGPQVGSLPGNLTGTQAGSLPDNLAGAQANSQLGNLPGARADNLAGTLAGSQQGAQPRPPVNLQPGSQPDSELGPLNPDLPQRILF